MSDRELLEFAAKAAGLPLEWGGKYKLGDDEIDCTDIPYVRSGQPDEGDVYWNPLDDDGDALRLAVKLGEAGFFRLNFGAGAVSTENPTTKPLPMLYACENMDELGGAAATRRAIVRAAAEIGRQMP